MGQKRSGATCAAFVWQNSRAIRGSIKVWWEFAYCRLLCFTRLSGVKIVHRQNHTSEKVRTGKKSKQFAAAFVFKYNAFFPQLRRRDKHIYMFFLRHIVMLFEKKYCLRIGLRARCIPRLYRLNQKAKAHLPWLWSLVCYSSSSSCFAAFFFFTKSTANTMVRAMATASTESPTMALVVMLC